MAKATKLHFCTFRSCVVQVMQRHLQRTAIQDMDRQLESEEIAERNRLQASCLTLHTLLECASSMQATCSALDTLLDTIADHWHKTWYKSC